MKKTRTMRMAAVLFALVLITSCFVGNTFAKYVASGEATDTARVAKFGVTITAPTTDDSTFKTKYATGTNDPAYSGEFSVQSSNDKVLAPGTSGQVGAFTVAGTPEVATRISYSIDDLTLSNWTAGGGFYFPVIFKVNGTAVNDGTETDAAAIKSKIAAALANASEDFAPNATITPKALTITWEWPFSTSAANDVKDTELGNAETAGTISLKVTCTVTQLD